MKVYILFALILLSVPLNAKASERLLDLITQEIAVANHISITEGYINDDLNVSYEKIGNRIVVKYSFLIGEGGAEESIANYRFDGTLESIKSDFHYAEHSMGPANRSCEMHVIRNYNWSGELVKVEGKLKVVMQLDGKIDENRKITKIDDDVLERLSKPLQRLSPEILHEVK